MAVRDLNKIPFAYRIKGIEGQLRKAYERLQGASDPRKIKKYGEDLKKCVDAYIEIKHLEFDDSVRWDI